MNYSKEHINELCRELLELGISVTPETIEIILRGQEKEFRDITGKLNPAKEFKRLQSKIKHIININLT